MTKATVLCYGMAALICLLTFVLSSGISLNSEDFILNLAGKRQCSCTLFDHARPSLLLRPVTTKYEL